jgi:hypothetical protein
MDRQISRWVFFFGKNDQIVQWILQVFFFRKTSRIGGGDKRYNAGKIEKMEEFRGEEREKRSGEEGKRDPGRKGKEIREGREKERLAGRGKQDT